MSDPDPRNPLDKPHASLRVEIGGKILLFKTGNICSIFERDAISIMLFNETLHLAKTPIVGEGGRVNVLFVDHCPFS